MSETTLMEESHALTETELDQLRDELAQERARAISCACESLVLEPEFESEIDPATDFGEDDITLYETVFKDFTPLNFMKLMEIGNWIEYKKNAVLVTEGETVKALSVIFSGAAVVSKDDSEITKLKVFDFVGDMSFTTHLPAAAETHTRVVFWTIEELNRKLDSSPDLRASLHAVVGAALVKN